MKILTQYDRLDSIYYSLIDILRYVAFVGLVVISMILSVTFYISAVEEMSSKIMLGFAAFGLESVKIYTLIFAEYTWYTISLNRKKKLSPQEIFRVLRPYTLFAFLTLLSIIASISFAQASIYSTIEEVQVVLEKEALVQEEGNPLIESKTRLLENKQTQLTLLNERIAILPADYVTASIKLSAEVNKLNDDIYAISEEIALIESTSFEEKVETTEVMSSKKATYNRFYLLGKPVGLNETQTLFLFLTLFAILLELGIISTAPAPEKRSIRELIETRLAKNGKKPITVSKKYTPKKKIPTPKMEAMLSSPIPDFGIKVDVNQSPSVAIEALPIKVDAKKKIRERGTSAQLLDELFTAGSSYLKEPSAVAYTNKRTASEYLHLIEKLAKNKPRGKDSLPFITKDKRGYKMNYSLKYIKSAVDKKKEGK